MLQALGLHQIAYLKLLFRGKVLLVMTVMPLQQELEMVVELAVVVEVVAVILANQHRPVVPAAAPWPRANREQLEQLEHLIRRLMETPEMLDNHL
jgi:hypothetical protein